MTKPKVSNAERTDWARVEAFSEADIERMAKNDKDNPATTGEDWSDTMVGLPALKTPVSAKFDADVVSWFKAQGPDYQARMNAALRHYMEVVRKAG